MNFDQLRDLAEKNEVSLKDHGGRKRTPPYYYDSLRQALGAYFNTFVTQNAKYNWYAEGLSATRKASPFAGYLDEDSTVISLTAFERFFELFLKDFLRKIDHRLNYVYQRPKKGNKAKELINNIRSGQLIPRKFGTKYLSPAFRESLDRVYGLIELSKVGDQDPIVKRFTRILKKYSFLNSEIHKGTLQLLSWYRDRILHNGDKLPNLWYLDYLVTQRVIPLIKEITDKEKDNLGESLFYFQTITGINIIDRLADIKFDFKDFKQKRKADITYARLLYIGHLKELGRANMNMNLFARKNHSASEYNYHDVKGRGHRFAIAEKKHENFRKIKNCICCGQDSMVLYRVTVEDIFNAGSKLNIDWVKCYTCDYHMRFNAQDPYFFKLTSKKLFD